MSRPTGVAATRRTALAGALGGALALSACDAEPPAATSTPTATPTTPAPDDPDDALVDQVVAELDELIGFVSSVSGPRRLERLTTRLDTLHRSHRAVLTDEAVSAETGPAVIGPAAQVERRVRRRETQAQRKLADWSLAADSGPLARLLASMSAAIAQQLAAPPSAPAGGPR